MKIYKYRDISQADETTLERLYQSILHKKFWCASLRTLNDKDEFKFRCDCTPTESTKPLLVQLLMKHGNTADERALSVAALQIDNNRLNGNAIPIINDMIEKCLSDFGLACFSSAKDDASLWKEYGGDGNGLCIEIDVPDDNKNLYMVNYVQEKVIHIDSLFKADLFEGEAFAVYRDMLLTKTTKYQPEKEVRFVSKKERNVAMTIEGSVVTEIMFGNKIESSMLNKVRADIKRHHSARSILLTQSERCS